MNHTETDMRVPGVDGLWEDGEWVDWNVVVEEREDRFGDENIFESVLAVAIGYLDATGRHLPIYGELDELYAERRFGIARHRPGQCGSDGRLGSLLVEIKTISPSKKNEKVRVKRAGNFGAVIVVKFDLDFRVNAKMILRKSLPKGEGKWIRIRWSDILVAAELQAHCAISQVPL